MDPLKLTPEIKLGRDYTHMYYSERKRISDVESTEIIKGKTSFTTDFLRKLSSKYEAFSEGLFPPNCRYLEKFQEGYLVIVENEPCMRTVRIHTDLSNQLEMAKSAGIFEKYNIKDPYEFFRDDMVMVNRKNCYKFHLAFPYVLMFLFINNNFKCDHGKMLAAKSQTRGFGDPLFILPLPNINDEGQAICFGDGNSKRQNSLTSAIESITMNFWSTPFNHDYFYNPDRYKNAGIVPLGNFFHWHLESMENPMFIYTCDWIPYDNNIFSILNSLKLKYRLSEKTQMSYETLEQLFYEREDSKITEGINSKSKRKYKLYYDLCSSVYLTRDIQLFAGDAILMNNGESAHIDNFVGFLDGGVIRYIVLDYKGKKIKLKYTDNCQNFLIKNIERQFFVSSAKLKNGLVVKAGDIIFFENEYGEKKYKKVRYIRKSRGDDGQHELKLGSEYYIAKNIEANKLDDQEHFQYGNTTLSKGKMYYCFDSERRNREGKNILNHLIYYQFNNLFIHEYDEGNIQFGFTVFNEEIETGKLQEVGSDQIPIEDQRRRGIKEIVEMNDPDIDFIPPIVRIGRKIYYVVDEFKNEFNYNTTPIIRKDGILAYDQERYSFSNDNNYIEPRNFQQIVKNGVFYLYGNDFDICFKIGDKVVAADHYNPIETLKIKTITGFEWDDNNLWFILKDKNGNETKIEYINTDSGKIHVATGRIRKVTTQYKDLKIGTKIKSDLPYVPNFPKKDINMVVAIVYDNLEEPLVLCSNGCTLWYSDVMENFTKIERNDPDYTKKNIAPFKPASIKYQPGDYLIRLKREENGPSNGWYSLSRTILLNHDSYYTNRLVYLRTESYPSFIPTSVHYHYGQRFNPNEYSTPFVFDCIPTPRIKQRQIRERLGLFHLHGGGSCVYDIYTDKVTLRNERSFH